RLASGPKWLNWQPLPTSQAASFSRMVLRSWAWKLSPSMTAAVTPSRRKTSSKVRCTVLVPAPDEPVMATIGWRSDMVSPPFLWLLSELGVAEQRARVEQRQIVLLAADEGLVVIALDALDLFLRAEHEADALVQALGLHVEHRAHAGAGAPAGLLDQEADRVAFVEQAQPPGLGRVLAVARVEEHAAAHQDAVGLGHQRGDPAHVEVGAARAGAAGQAFVHVAAHGLLPEARVGGVDGELARGFGHADVAVGEVELA